MKRIILFLFMLFILNVGVMTVNANPYKKTFKYNGNDITNCTWFAWQQAYNKAGVSLPGWGNASTWYNSAKNAGFEVGQTPRAKSIVVWSWMWKGKNYGHVGYVEKVVGDKIYVWDSDSTCTDQNDPEYKACLSESVSQETDEACFDKYAKTTACEFSASYWSSPGDLIGYIYLDNVPKATTTKKKTTTSTTAKDKSTTEKVEKNVYLSGLDIYPGGIKFDKNTFEYEVDYYTDVNFIIINATAEDDNATIEGTGKLELNNGRNEYKINVKLDDVITTYTIIFNNLEELKPKVTVTNRRTSNYPMPIDIMFGVVTGITIFVFSYGIYRRKC